MEKEIKKGFWLQLMGPPIIAFDGVCDKTTTLHHVHQKNDVPSDLWLSMMCAAGYENGKLAKVLIEDEGETNNEACDQIS